MAGHRVADRLDRRADAGVNTRQAEDAFGELDRRAEAASRRVGAGPGGSWETPRSVPRDAPAPSARSASAPPRWTRSQASLEASGGGFGAITGICASRPEGAGLADAGDGTDQAKRRAALQTRAPSSMRAWLKVPAPVGGTSRSAASQSRRWAGVARRSSRTASQRARTALRVRLEDRRRAVERERRGWPRRCTAPPPVSRGSRRDRRGRPRRAWRRPGGPPRGAAGPVGSNPAPPNTSGPRAPRPPPTPARRGTGPGIERNKARPRPRWSAPASSPRPGFDTGRGSISTGARGARAVPRHQALPHPFDPGAIVVQPRHRCPFPRPAARSRRISRGRGRALPGAFQSFSFIGHCCLRPSVYPSNLEFSLPNTQRNSIYGMEIPNKARILPMLTATSGAPR